MKTLRIFPFMALSLWMGLSPPGLAQNGQNICQVPTTPESSRPNVLFLLDNSGSMNNIIRDENGRATDQKRIDALKEALLKTLDNAHNVNIGLARFASLFDKKAEVPVNVPILFPVSSLDQPLYQISGEDDEPIKIVAAINQSSGDAEENQETGEIFLNNPQLQVAQNENPLMIGLRFEAVDIPQGAKIVSANLELVSGTNASTPTDLVIRAENVDDTLPFTDENYNISNRPTTTGAVSWNTVNSWQEGATYTSPDLTSLVQSIVNRQGWCGGNRLTFIISANGENPSVKAYDDLPIFAPRLTVEYDSKAINSIGCINQNWSGQISTSTDDAEEKIGDTKYVYTNNTILELGQRSTDETDPRLVGFRFKEVPISPNAKIVKAHLILTSQNVGKDRLDGTLSIFGEKSPNATSFVSGTAPNLSDRSATSTKILWTPEETWELNKRYQSPDISEVIEEIIQQPEWQIYNSLALFITGSGRFDIASFGTYPMSAAVLHIQVEDYLGPGGQEDLMTVRRRLKQIVQKIEIPMSLTPLVDGLYEATQYYLGKPVDYGKDRHGQKDYLVSHPGTYTGGIIEGITTDCNSKKDPHDKSCANERISGDPVYVKPRTSNNQPNHIVLLTDGIPTKNTSLENNKIQNFIAQLGGNTDCISSYTIPNTEETLNVSSRATCGIDLADALAENNILVHTVGFTLGKGWQTAYKDLKTGQRVYIENGNYYYEDGSEALPERIGAAGYEENIKLTEQNEEALKFLCRMASQGEEGVGSVDWCSDRYFHQANSAEELYNRILPEILGASSMEAPSDALLNIATVGKGTVNMIVAPPINGMENQGNLDDNVNTCNIDCGTGCAETYQQGTTIKLTATPAPGFVFTSWEGDCDSNTINPLLVKMSQYNVNCTAMFKALPNETPTAPITETPAISDNEIVETVTGENQTTGDEDIASVIEDSMIEDEPTNVVPDVSETDSMTDTAPITEIPGNNETVTAENQTTDEKEDTALTVIEDSIPEPTNIVPNVSQTDTMTDTAPTTETPVIGNNDTVETVTAENQTIGEQEDTALSTIEDSMIEMEPILLLPKNVVEEERLPYNVVVTPPGPITQCPPTGLIDWPCKNHEQVLTDATLGNQVSIAGGELAGTITNQGMISNVTIQDQTTVSGGKFSGYIVNEGTLADFEFVGAKITGGTLSGTIYNKSEIGGFFQNVQLAPNTHIIGGAIAGNIQGDCEAPAQLENVTVKANSQLSCVTLIGDLSETTENSITLADGIILQNPTLAADSYLIGGQLQGNIFGDVNAPAQLENVEILADSHLVGVILGNGVTLADNVTYGDGVQFLNPETSETTEELPSDTTDPEELPSETTDSDELPSETTNSDELPSETTDSDELPSETTDTEELPILESAIAVNTKGEITDSEAVFSGGIAINTGPFESSATVTLSDGVDIRGRIEIATEHQRQVADSLVVVAYQPKKGTGDLGPGTGPIFLMLDENGDILPWNFDMGSLVTLQAYQTQTEIVEMLIYQGQLPATGMINIYFGYRLMDGTVIYSPQTLDIMISE